MLIAYPTITFEGDTVEPQGCNERLVHGELTIRDVTREVSLDARYLGKQETSYWENGEDRGPVDRIVLPHFMVLGLRRVFFLVGDRSDRVHDGFGTP